MEQNESKIYWVEYVQGGINRSRDCASYEEAEKVSNEMDAQGIENRIVTN